MSNVRWAQAALIALALPACASAGTQTAFSRPTGQASQPGSWQPTQGEQRAEYRKAAEPRGQAEQPYAWVDSAPVYPKDQHRVAQDGMTYAGGRAGQPGSWKQGETTSWALQIASNDDGKAKQ